MAITLTPVRPVTDAELLELSRLNPGYTFEILATGELVVTPPAAPESGRCEVKLLTQLEAWAERDGSGVVFSPSVGFRLPDGSLRCPDASWLRRDRWERLTPSERKHFFQGCPDAVFEIASPSDSADDLRAKIRAYVSNGARLAVLILPEARRIEVYRPGVAPQLHADPAAVALDPELAGFTLDPGPLLSA